MSGPTQPSSTRTYYEPSPFAKWYANALMHPKSGLSIGLAESSRIGQTLQGVNKGNRKAIKEFWGGYEPSAADFAAMQRGSTDFYAGRKQPTETKTAAQGGLMALRGYASGGKTETPEEKNKRLLARQEAGKKMTKAQSSFLTDYAATTEAGSAPGMNGKPVNKSLNDEQAAFVKQAAKKMENGQPLTEAEKTRLNTIEGKTGKNVSPFTEVGKTAPSNKGIASAAEQISTYNATPPPKPGEGQTQYSLANAMYGQIAGYDPNQKERGGITNEFGQKAMDYALNMKAPDEYGQASDMYRTAGAGLQGAAGYKPQDVSYQNASAERAAAQQASAAQMGQIANVNAERAAAERAATAQMGPIADIAAQRAQTRGYDAALMNAPERVAASDYEAAQMQKAGDVSTKDLTAYQMEGPGAWIDEGMAQQYMNPYIQGVVDISKREAERDYLKQQNALNAKAMSAGAFGGARQALERSEAQRNYNEQLQDIQTRGLSEAYTQGRSQYSTDTAAQQAARIQNLQSQLGTQSQSAQQALQAALANQSAEMQTAQQNMAALNAQKQNFVNQQLQAAINNYGGELTAEQANQVAQNAAAQFYSTAENQAAMQYATQALQAAQANQQTQFGVGSLNANLSQQANQQNAQLGTQVNLANQQAALQAALANQQTQFGVGSLNANLANQTNLQNANLGTQAAMQNAQLGTNVNLANSQYGLNAAMANQQAGLQGNQQNIAAYGAMGNMASGLGSIGQYNANFNQQYLGNLGQMYNTTQGLQQSYLDKQQQNAINQQLGGNKVGDFIAPGTAGGLMGNSGQGTQNIQ